MKSGRSNRRNSTKRKKQPVAFWRTLVTEQEETGTAVEVVARKHGVSANSLYRWC